MSCSNCGSSSITFGNSSSCSCKSCRTGKRCFNANGSSTDCRSCSSSSSDCSAITVTGEKEIIIKDCKGNKKKKCGRSERCTFNVVLTNLNFISPNPVKFILLKDENGAIHLQWETFTGIIGAKGAAFIAVGCVIPYTPCKSTTFTVPRSYNGTGGYSLVEISNDGTEQIKFYIQPTKDGSSVEVGDTVIFNGSCVTWIS